MPVKSNTLADRIRRTRKEWQFTGTGTSFNETWADGKECITLSTELSGVLRINEVQSSLGDPIGHRSGVFGLLDEFGITSSARDVYDLLLGAPLDQRKEGVSGGDRPNDIGLVLFHRSDAKHYQVKGVGCLHRCSDR